jgi:hypothetical protein
VEITSRVVRKAWCVEKIRTLKKKHKGCGTRKLKVVQKYATKGLPPGS